MISLLSLIRHPVGYQKGLQIPGTNLCLISAAAGKRCFQGMDYFLMFVVGGWGLLSLMRDVEKSKSLPKARNELASDIQLDLFSWSCQQNFGFQPILRFTRKQLELLFRIDDDVDASSEYFDSHEEEYSEGYMSASNEEDEEENIESKCLQIESP
ncbi:hypothetical protein ACLKA7_010268 [Drosophila subpalustris]